MFDQARAVAAQARDRAEQAGRLARERTANFSTDFQAATSDFQAVFAKNAAQQQRGSPSLSLAAELHIAATEGDIERLTHLLGCGADADEREPSRNTPFYEVVCKGKLKAARMLLQYGADSRTISVDKGIPLLHRCAAYGALLPASVSC